MNNIKIGSTKDGQTDAHTIVGHAYNGQTGEKSCMQRERLKTSDNETNTKLWMKTTIEKNNVQKNNNIVLEPSSKFMEKIRKTTLPK